MKLSFNYRSNGCRFVGCTVFLGGIVVASASSSNAKAFHPSKSGAVTQKRKSTDPPAPAKGKLGQDLFIAVGMRNLPMVISLLKKGADPDARNGLEFTPLYMAAATHQDDAMQVLLKAGAKPEAESAYGTPVMFAAASANQPGVDLLLQHHVSVNVSRVDGMTPLMMAANSGAPNVVDVLIKHGASVNATDNDGATALMYAARGGFEQAGKLLISAGATINVADSDRQTPLMFAAMNGHKEFVRMLITKGANPNVRDGKGRTALMLCATYGDNPEVVKVLLGSGANPKLLNAKGMNAAACAAIRGYLETARILGEPKLATSGATGSRTPVDAVQVSLKLLQSSMLRFNDATTCVSCHHEGLGRIASAVARDHGFKLDSSVQRAQMERVSGMMAAMRPLHEGALKNQEVMKQVPLIEINEVTSTYTWLLAAMASQGQSANESTAAAAMVLARQQMPDGGWIFGVPREPMQSSNITFTALSIRALKAYGPKAQAKEIQARVQRGKAWLMAAKPVNSEDRASLLMGLNWAGASAPEKATVAAQILADQRPDGGWAQLPNLKSDAYATGQALYALHEAGGLPVMDQSYSRGVKYLLRTQDDDGSWFVNKRASPANNHFNAGFPNGKSQYSSFIGTCWATMALAETVNSKAAKVASR